MSIRDAALAAFETSREDQASDARSSLATMLGPADVSSMQVVWRQVRPQYSVVVFEEDGVQLAVVSRDGPWQVRLTSGSGDSWSEGRPVTSLAHLGLLLDGGRV